MFFFGSRSLPASVAHVPALVARHALPGPVWVGCAIGADLQFALAMARLGRASDLHIGAVGGPEGGFPHKDSLPTILALEAAGAHITWWAGGGSDVDIRTRLRQRTIANITWAAEGGATLSVGVFGSPGSRGSSLSVRQSLRAGLRTYAVFGWQGPARPSCARWMPANSASLGRVWQAY